MKQKQLGKETVILELDKDELGLIIYLNETSSKKLTKKERAFIEEIKNIIKKMHTIEEAEKSIKGIFRK